jgi:hypothetical protein
MNLNRKETEGARMMLKIGLIVAVLAVVVALALWLRTRSETAEGIASVQKNQRQLTEAEIRDLLRTIPKAGWHGAQEIQSHLHEEDKAISRKVALEILATMESSPIEDYWTLRSLAEIAGHPIPDESAQSVIGHFKRMEKNREMLGPTLVLIGTESAGKALIEAEEANEGRYFSRVAFPLEDAAEHGRLDAGFRETLSKHFARRAEKNAKAFAKDGLGSLWMLVDSQSAVERLTREPFWSPDFEGHWDVLQALVKNAAKVPEERLWAFDELVKRRAAANDKTLYPNPDIVWLLARIHSERVDGLVEKLKQHPDLADRALAAEAALLGIIQPRRIVHRHLEAPGYANSPAPVRHLWALELLGMELVNGGIHQYFFNSSGDLWPDAIAGLEQAGYARSAAAIKKAVAIFGQEGPSTNRTIRFKQLDRLSKSAEAELNRFGDQVYEGMAETNTWPYIIRNAEIFRTEPPRQSPR